MAEDNLEWVFDSLVEFLRGPVWNIPVLTFIEQKSVVFEPGAENEEEFRKIHENYKNLVDFMLGSYMEDIRITPEQFETACTVASKKALTQFHQNLFEQVWAADDFEIFRRMMTQKNLELQLQALEVLAQKYGLSPDFMEPAGGCKPTKEEETIMKEIIRKAVAEQKSDDEEAVEEVDNEIKDELHQALEERDRLETQRQKEQELMDLAMKMSLNEANESVDLANSSPSQAPPTPNPSPTADVDKDGDEEPGDPEDTSAEAAATEKTNPKAEDECDANTVPKTVSPTTLIAIAEAVSLAQESSDEQNPTDDALLGEANETSSNGSSAGSLHVEVSTPTRSKSSLSFSSPLKASENTAAPQHRPWSDGIDQEYDKARIEVAPIEMERRQNYLRQQRDKLLAMKRQERAKNLTAYERTAGEQRPKSARAARKILRQESSDENIDPQTLAFRKSLASRLKSEVVDKTI